jgi:hypothetical protein
MRYRHWLYAIVFLLLCHGRARVHAQQQAPLLDAIEITRLIKEAQAISATPHFSDSVSTAALRIIAKYLPADDALEYGHVLSHNENNPFFAAFLQLVTEPQSSAPEGKVGQYFSEGVSNWMGLDVTNAAAGLTDFLIERTRTELNTAFFRRFQEDLNQPKFQDLRVLFPETWALLNVLGTEIYKYDAYLNNMRLAFHNDLDDLLENTVTAVRNHENDFGTRKGIYHGLLLALEAAYELDQGMAPGEVVHQLAFGDEMAQLVTSVPGSGDWVNVTRLLAMISESLRDTSGGERYWVKERSIRELQDMDVLRIYFGLLYEWSKNDVYQVIAFTAPRDITFCQGQVLRAPEVKLDTVLFMMGSCWDDIQDSIEVLRQFVTRIGDRVDQVEQELAAFRNTKEQVDRMEQASSAEQSRLLFEAFNEVVSSTLDLTEEAYELKKLPFIHVRVPDTAATYIAMIRIAQRMAACISEEQYGSAITHLADLLRKVWKSPTGSSPSDTLFKASVVQRIMKYGSFMASLIGSDSPETAKRAIEAAALPPGSYTIKRASRFSVALNGYLGAYLGHEDIEGVDNDSPWVNTYGLTAPVGIGLTWGNVCRASRHPSSFGFLLTLIDLGTVASFRMDDETVEEVPTITLGSIVAPGAFLEWGIGGTPLSLGLGAQMGPRLRKLTADDAKTGDAYVRWGLTLKVDIPLLHFSASPE